MMSPGTRDYDMDFGGWGARPVSSLQFADLQGDFDEMQGEPIQFLAESHCAVRSSKDSSLSKDQGGASGIAGKSRVAKGPDAGITDRPERGLVRVVTRLRRSITF